MKKLIAMLVLVGLSLSMVGCGGGSAPKPADTKKTDATKPAEPAK
jgi:Flp pilus assembly protein TadD